MAITSVVQTTQAHLRDRVELAEIFLGRIRDLLDLIDDRGATQLIAFDAPTRTAIDMMGRLMVEAEENGLVEPRAPHPCRVTEAIQEACRVTAVGPG